MQMKNQRNEKGETFACFDNESELAVHQAGWSFRARREIAPHEISAAIVRAEVTFQRSASRRSDGTFYLLRTPFAIPYSENMFISPIIEPALVRTFHVLFLSPTFLHFKNQSQDLYR